MTFIYDILKSGYTIGAAGAVVALSVAAWIYDSVTGK